MSEELKKLVNEPGLWVVAIAMVSIVLAQAILFARQAFIAAEKIGMDRRKCIEGLRAGMITAIGPSLAIIVVMIGMMAVVGAPITWMRLSIIGAAPTELTAATLGAKAIGVEFGSKAYDLRAFVHSNWGMALNDFGWLFLCALFTHRLETLRLKVGGGDMKWLAVLSGSAAIGAFAYLMSGQLIAGGPRTVGVIAGGVCMWVLLVIARKFKWLREYTLGIAMIAGMLIANLFA